MAEDLGGVREGEQGTRSAISHALPHPRVQDGTTALIKSAQNGHVEVARLLLEGKADIHAATQVRREAQGMRNRRANLVRLG